MRSYIPEKKRKGQRSWVGKQDEHKRCSEPAAGASEYGKSLLRRRGEFVERSLRTATRPAECGAATWAGRENILKRQLVHVGAFNLSLILRQC